MLFDNVSILSVEAVDAPHRVTSAELEARLAPLLTRLGVPANFLQDRSGICARREWDPDTMPSHAAMLAGEKALERAGIARSRVGVVINTSVCRDYVEPSVACIVHAKLGLSPSCINFDLGNACLGFMNGMEVVGNMIERGQVDYGLIVDGENSHHVVDATINRMLADGAGLQTFKDHFATLTLGSGGVAMVLARSDLAPHGHRFRGGVALAATEHHGLCKGQVDGMVTDTGALLVAGIKLALQTLQRARDVLQWQPEDLNEIVLHQVSRAHTEKLAETLELDLSKILPIYPEYGNIGPAALPIALVKAVEQGRIQPGHRVGLMGIGSGLNCAMAEVIW